MVKLRIFVLLSVLVLGLLATTGSASAAYLCPVVGDGILTADIVIQKPLDEEDKKDVDLWTG